jgi:hypothetical protein
MDTEELIRRLSSASQPVRPLPGPWLRTAIWFGLAVPFVAMVVVVMSPRADLAAKYADWHFAVEQIAALATALVAAAAAFATTVPGFDRRVLYAPFVPLAVWLGSIGQGCLQTLMRDGLGGLTLTPGWVCLPAILLVGSVPATAIAFMLRRGAPLTPRLTGILGGLAAAGLGNVGLRLFHAQDASIMVLVWQVGSVFLLTVIAGGMGRFLLNWGSLIKRNANV